MVSLSHRGICVSDLAASSRFYQEALGFEAYQDHGIVEGPDMERTMELPGVRLRAVMLKRPDGPVIDPGWGEPDLSPAEQVFGWCSFDVLAMKSGVPETPVNAVPPSAWARCALRFVVGIDPTDVVPALRRHLDRHGFRMVEIIMPGTERFGATRLHPEDDWVRFTLASIARSTNKKPALLPNLGGSLPNDIFAEVLGLKTIWVPHSYPGCSQHAPDEHLLPAVAREGLLAMTAVLWDVGERGAELLRRTPQDSFPG